MIAMAHAKGMKRVSKACANAVIRFAIRIRYVMQIISVCRTAPKRVETAKNLSLPAMGDARAMKFARMACANVVTKPAIQMKSASQVYVNTLSHQRRKILVTI